MGRRRAKGPAFDPSENVLQLVRAETKRQDDLREQEGRHTRELADERERHWREMAAKEAGRLDAIRQVDQINVMAKAEATLIAVQTLAASQSASAHGVNERLAAVEKSIYEGQGRGGGISAFYGWIASGVMLIYTLWSLLGKH